MGSALKIRDDLTPLELRRWARRESHGRASARAYAIANALEEMTRATAARLAGMDRQTLRDAVVRYNAEISPHPDFRAARIFDLATFTLHIPVQVSVQAALLEFLTRPAGTRIVTTDVSEWVGDIRHRNRLGSALRLMF